MPETGGTPERRTEEAMDLMDIIQQELRVSSKVLPVRSMEFLNETLARLKQYGAKTSISPKQLFWLRDIRDRVL